jgi:hypothetical protein
LSGRQKQRAFLSAARQLRGQQDANPTNSKAMQSGRQGAAA